MYRLVIAEKPSVAMCIAQVLGAAARKEATWRGAGRQWRPLSAFGT